MAMADQPGVGKQSADARAKVRESMKQLLQKGGPMTKVKELPKTGQAPKVTVDFGYSKFDQIGREEEAAEVMDASKRNEEFFRQLEKDYGQMCKQDGWDEVLKAAKEEPKKARPFEEIPADSDYHRVALPGGGRELRFDPERGRQLLAQLPQKPRRNLDALRKVEAETREAMEKERKRLAEMPKSEPIRTRSDVVYLDTLDDDSEAESPKTSEPLRTKSEVVQLDKLSDTDEEVEDPEVRRKQENALAALRAFEEFDRLGREKDAMLAKYRDKYG